MLLGVIGKQASASFLYFPTKSSDQRNVLLFSTVKLILGVTINDAKKKPAISKLYDFTKAGTDVMQHQIGAFTRIPKSIAWTLTAFCYMFDVHSINASTVFAFNKKRLIYANKIFYDFGMNLAFYLFVRPSCDDLYWSLINVKNVAFAF